MQTLEQWKAAVRSKLDGHNGIYCQQAKILAQFAAKHPTDKKRLNWLIAEAKERGFNLTLAVKPDGIEYHWKQRRLKFDWEEEKRGRP
jgi:hypothetical protein